MEYLVKGLKVLLVAIVFVFIGLNILVGFMGVSSILLTISMYFSVWFVLHKSIHLVVKNSNRKNYQLFLASIILSLFMSELVLKYVVKSNLSYSEQNQRFLYTSLYDQHTFGNLYQKFIRKNTFQVLERRINKAGFVRKPEFKYVQSFNSLGFRDSEPQIDTSKITIIALGDSFTEGKGSSQDSTWVNLFKNNLNRLDSTKSIQTINAGCIGSDPIEEFFVFETKKLLKYKPKVLIVSINKSDIGDIIVRGGKERFVNGSILHKQGPWWEFFYSFSNIFRACAHSFFGVNYLLLTENQNKVATEIAIKKLEESILIDYKNLAMKNSFKLVVVLHPIQEELEIGKFSLNQLYQELEKDTNITTVNLFDEYIALKKEKKFEYKELYWKMDLHHNAKGYKLWADILSPKILRLIE